MKVITNVAEIDAQIDAAKEGSVETRARVAMELTQALKQATGLRNFNDLQAAGGDVQRLRSRILVELLNIPKENHMTDIDQQESIDLPEVTEGWLRKDIADHLVTYHGGDSWAFGSHFYNEGGFTKARKDSLIALHDKIHADEGKYSSLMHRPHVHDDALNSNAEGARTDQTPGDTPRLSSGERRTLEKLVDNDFAALHGEIEQVAADTLADRMEMLAEEFKDQAKKAQRYTDRAEQARSTYIETLRKLVVDADAEGITITGNVPQVGNVSACGNFVVAERKEKEAAIASEVARDRDRALRTLERKRLQTQRTVLLTGLGGNAETILDAIPSAQSLMLEAAQERRDLKAIST